MGKSNIVNKKKPLEESCNFVCFGVYMIVWVLSPYTQILKGLRFKREKSKEKRERK